MSVIELDKTAPQDRKLAMPFCTCVYDTYFDNFNQAEKNNMFLGTPAPPEHGQEREDPPAGCPGGVP